MGLLIKGGEIVTADSRYTSDIYIEDENITSIGRELYAPFGTEVIDATGKLVFPGFIDPHVHIHLPFMATFAKDTHATASQAALIGGTTTFIEMVCPSRHEDALAGYNDWKQRAEGNSACDYSFHMAVTRFDAETEAQLREIVADGTASFKVFLAYKNFFGVTDDELFHTLKLAAELGVITTAHCENAELVAQLQQQLLAAGKTGPEWHEPSRPEAVEAEGTARFATFLEQTGAAGYVVHLSCAPALHAAVQAKLRGVRIYVESVLPHFLLDKSYAGTHGRGRHEARHVAAAARKRNLPILWSALEAGLIDTVGTDHCPFDTEQKLLGAAALRRFPTAFRALKTA
jgi:dihydropyrimidinase